LFLRHVLDIRGGFRIPQRSHCVARGKLGPRRHRLALDAHDERPFVVAPARHVGPRSRPGGDFDASPRGITEPGGADAAREMIQGRADGQLRGAHR